jgi:RimJ/RimL family protein N-acetyltransferase
VDVYLETEHLLLRWFTADDLALIIELDSDPQVKRYIDNGAPADRADLIETLEWWLTHYPRAEGYGFWAAIDKATQSFIGWFHFRPGDGAGPLEPELGYRLRRQAWGKGFGTEGSVALIDKGFRELGVERVYAQTMAVNIGSRRVMEKCGMRLVREFRADWPVRIPGDEEGDVEYAITRDEWLAPRKSD